MCNAHAYRGKFLCVGRCPFWLFITLSGNGGAMNAQNELYADIMDNTEAVFDGSIGRSDMPASFP